MTLNIEQLREIAIKKSALRKLDSNVITGFGPDIVLELCERLLALELPEQSDPEYKEIHFENIKDVGLAWHKPTKRVWVCFDGVSVFRSKVMLDEMIISFELENKIV